MARHTATGRIGEQIAVRHLERAGMVVLARNWRCRLDEVRGELDVVAEDGAVLVFCEVKTRRGVEAGVPLVGITPRKQAQLRRLAAAWLAARPAPDGHRPVRFDAVAVSWPRAGGRAEVVHLRGVC